MPKDASFCTIVAMGDYLSGWLEATAIKSADSQSVAPIVFHWISRFGLIGQLVCDNGSQIKGLTQELVKHYLMKNVRIASYQSQANGIVKRGHQPVFFFFFFISILTYSLYHNESPWLCKAT